MDENTNTDEEVVVEEDVFPMELTQNELVVLHMLFNSNTISVPTNLLGAANGIKQKIGTLSLKAGMIVERG